MTNTLVAPSVRRSGARRQLRSHRRLGTVAHPPAPGPTTRPVRVMLIDDDAMARSWLRLSLRDCEFRVVGEATSAIQALTLIGERAVDVLVVDHRLPDTSGIELVRELRDRGVTVPAVLTSTMAEAGFNDVAREAGAQGTLLKTGSPAELLDALRTVRTGLHAFDLRHPRRNPIGASLSPREREVLTLVAEGATNREIASMLGIGIETVKTLLRRTFAKLGVQRRVQAVWAARELGLV